MRRLIIGTIIGCTGAIFLGIRHPIKPFRCNLKILGKSLQTEVALLHDIRSDLKKKD